MSQADHTASNTEPPFHPVSHYDSPQGVLDDATLSSDEKRVILSSWASDMFAMDSRPVLREIPGIPHRLHFDEILAALKQLDDQTDPPPNGGLAMRLPRFSQVECTGSQAPLRVIERDVAVGRHRSVKAPRPRNHFRWSREANVRRYRKLLNNQLTDLERSFEERRLAEELHGRLPFTTMEGTNVCQL